MVSMLASCEPLYPSGKYDGLPELPAENDIS
jgi:hypothetical protein